MIEGLNSPKQLEINYMKPSVACEYNQMWHRTLPKIHYTAIVRSTHYKIYGAFYGDSCVAVAMWSSPVSRYLDRFKYLELRRFAISPDAPKYTATWMIGKMVKDIKKSLPDIEILISYQDADFHDGIIYKASNWTPVYLKNKGNWGGTRTDRQKSVSNLHNKIRWEYHLK